MIETLETDCTDLLKSNMGLVYSCVRKYVRRNEEPEDLPEFSDAYYGLLIASRGFDPSLGWKFSTYAIPIIQRMIWRGRKKRFRFNFSSLDDLTKEIGISASSLPSFDKIMEVVDCGDAVDSEIFKEFFVNRMTQAEIADKYNVSQQRVAQRLGRVKKLLMEHL